MEKTAEQLLKAWLAEKESELREWKKQYPAQFAGLTLVLALTAKPFAEIETVIVDDTNSPTEAEWENMITTVEMARQEGKTSENFAKALLVLRRNQNQPTKIGALGITHGSLMRGFMEAHSMPFSLRQSSKKTFFSLVRNPKA